MGSRASQNRNGASALHTPLPAQAVGRFFVLSKRASGRQRHGREKKESSWTHCNSVGEGLSLATLELSGPRRRCQRRRRHPSNSLVRPDRIPAPPSKRGKRDPLYLGAALTPMRHGFVLAGPVAVAL